MAVVMRSPRGLQLLHRFCELDLAFSALVAIAGAVSVVVPAPSLIRAMIATPLLLFVPGYLFLLILYPRRQDVGIIFRIGFAITCSIALMAGVSFILSYSSPGLSAQTLIAGMNFLIALLLVGAAVRRQAEVASRGEPFLPALPERWHDDLAKTIRSPARLFLIMMMTLAAGAVVLGFVVPPPQERFTELIANDYAYAGTGGASPSLTIELRNHEGVSMNYTLAAVLTSHTTDPLSALNETIVVDLLDRSSVRVEDGEAENVVLSVPFNGTGGADHLDVVLFRSEIPPFTGQGDLLLHQSYRNLSLRLPYPRE